MSGKNDFYTKISIDEDSMKSRTSQSQNCFIMHNIEPGDTLMSLAIRYNISTGAIKQLNSMISNEIAFRKTIKIPQSDINENFIKSSKYPDDSQSMSNRSQPPDLIREALNHRRGSQETVSSINSGLEMTLESSPSLNPPRLSSQPATLPTTSSSTTGGAINSRSVSIDSSNNNNNSCISNTCNLDFLSRMDSEISKAKNNLEKLNEKSMRQDSFYRGLSESQSFPHFNSNHTSHHSNSSSSNQVLDVRIMVPNQPRNSKYQYHPMTTFASKNNNIPTTIQQQHYNATFHDDFYEL